MRRTDAIQLALIITLMTVLSILTIGLIREAMEANGWSDPSPVSIPEDPAGP